MKISKHINLILMPLLCELRGYNILYYGYIRYFFEKNLDSNNLISIKTIPIKAENFQQWESLTVFLSSNQAKFPYYDSIFPR